MLCTYTAQTLPLNWIPTLQGRLIFVPFCWAWKVPQTFFKRGRSKIRESFSKITSWVIGFWSFLALSGRCSPKVLDDTVWQQTVNPRLLGSSSNTGSPKRPAFYTKRPKYFLEFSVAENWAPLIFSCSHNHSNPLNPSNLHPKKKYIYMYIYIWTQKKTYLQSLYKYTHPIFYGTRFATEERGSRLWHVYTSSAITANGSVCKPVFSVLL